MALTIVVSDPTPTEQTGEVTRFYRRIPEQSRIEPSMSLEQVYDHIRMLDEEGYPNAYINVGALDVKFKNARFSNGEVVGSFKICERNENEN